MPARIAGIGLRQTLGDLEALAIGFQRAGQIPLRPRRTSPIFAKATERSRCEAALLGSDQANRMAIARLSP